MWSVDCDSFVLDSEIRTPQNYSDVNCLIILLLQIEVPFRNENPNYDARMLGNVDDSYEGDALLMLTQSGIV